MQIASVGRNLRTIPHFNPTLSNGSQVGTSRHYSSRTLILRTLSAEEDDDEPIAKRRKPSRKPRNKPKSPPWTPEEDERLRQLVRVHGNNDWGPIAEAMGRSSPWECSKRLYYISTKDSPRRTVLTAKQDALLLKLVNDVGPQFREFVKHFPKMSARNLYDRYRRLTRPPELKAWTPGEITQLRAAIAKYGIENWAEVATAVGTRNSYQCYSRWYRYPFDPDPPGQWNVDLDLMLLLCAYDARPGLFNMAPTFRTLCGTFRALRPETYLSPEDLPRGPLTEFPDLRAPLAPEYEAGANREPSQRLWHRVALIISSGDALIHPHACCARFQHFINGEEIFSALTPPQFQWLQQARRSQTQLTPEAFDAMGISIVKKRIPDLIRTMSMIRYISDVIKNEAKGISWDGGQPQFNDLE
ncbi:Myblike DNAbinding domain-containing protein [Tieghemiomyces parasiticus]|uniref:Myblike DNAbinding domain-containing protein n=1 Tax=Tieghemiomyces parasiticus TaxID=78921 RepID=A0A9W8DWY6_9FUNG|nr:Myblike DNAbinding domain-containing protein [Tieghemiomyces parasiticus]